MSLMVTVLGRYLSPQFEGKLVASGLICKDMGVGNEMCMKSSRKTLPPCGLKCTVSGG